MSDKEENVDNSHDQEASCSYKNTNSPLKLNNDSSSESSSTSKDGSADESSEGEENEVNIDNKIQSKLKQCGLNRRNVKTIIHELLNDENVLSILKANIGGTTPSINLPEPKILRSKKKKTLDDKSEPRFTELELPEEEDDEDEEYNPANESAMDFEDASTQDTVRSTTDLELDTSIEGTDQKSDEAIDTVTTTTTVNEDTPSTSSFIRDLNQIDREIQAIDKNATNCALTEDEIIAQRTRSKHSLLDIAMAEIETAFQPPDVTEDMYHPSGDTDWHKWLAELTMDDNMLPELPKEDEEDDPEKDPDYNFIESESEDIVEKEDFQDDRGTRVSKKELQELLDLLNVPDDFLTYQGEPITPTPPPAIQTLDTTSSVKHVTFSKPKSTPKVASPAKPATVREQLAILKEQKDYVPMQASSAPVAPEAFVLTKKQRETLDLQMRQHIQLLCQVNLLCRNSKKLSTNVHDSHALLKEIDQLAEYNKTSMKVNKSTFEVNNIKEALTIAKLNIKDSEPVTRLTKHEREKGLHPISRCVAMLMATSGVFQFASLLPTAGAATTSGVRVTFTQHEDNILVLGLSQMEKHFVPWYILVHQYMMPTKKPEQIRCRALNANNGHYGAGNPIRRFRRTGQLPRVPPVLSPSVGEGTGLANFLQFCDEKVPDWLIALQQEGNSLVHQNMSGGNTTKPKKVHIQSTAVTSASNIPSVAVANTVHIPSTAVTTTVPIQSTTVPNTVYFQSGTVQNAFQIRSTAVQNAIQIPSTIVTNLAPGSIVLPTIVTAPKPAPRTQFTPIRLPPVPHGSSVQNSSKKLIESIKKSFSPKKNKKVSPTKKLFHKKRGRKPKMKDLPERKQSTKSDNILSNKPTQPFTTNQPTSTPTSHTTSVTQQHNICDVTTDPTAAEKTAVVAEGDFPNGVAVNDVLGNSPDEAMEVTKENDVEEIVADEMPDLNDVIHDADDDQMTEEDDLDEMGDTEDDEAPPSPKDGTQSGGDSPQRNPGNGKDARSDEDTLSDEEQTGNNEDQKSTKNTKKSRVRWKNNKGEDPVAWRQTKSGRISKKLGGRLHRIHPGLAGKKTGGGKSRAQEDQLSLNLRRSAEDVRLLEEDTIVQLDPSRVEKEMLFAQGYLKKMEESLKDRPELLMQVLDILCQFDSDTSQSPSSLFIQLSNILKEHPELLRGFAPFLLPEQAHSCGLLQEQQVYARARKFLRQLEIRFHDNPQHLNKILSAFHAVAEGSIFTEQELKRSILSLLKSDPYLQEEFLMFFDDERPPESRLHGDYELVTWNDDLAKEVSTPYEYVYIPSAEGSDQIGVEEGHSDVTKSPGASHLRHNKRSDVTRFGGVKEVVEVGNDAPEENNGDWEENPKSDEDTDEEEEEVDDVVCNIRSDSIPEEEEPASLCLPTDIGVISEDALSCSPFKRHNSLSTSNSHPPDRPMTPIHSTDSLGAFPLPDHGVQGTQSSSLGSDLPTTPTGSPKDKSSTADVKISEAPASWTRECDALLLSVCKDMGPGKKAFAKASELLKRSVDETSCRFAHLMSLLAGEGDLTDDTDTTSLNSDTDGQQSDAD